MFLIFSQLLINVSTCIHSFRQSLKLVNALWLNQVFPISMHITICENSIAFHSIKKEFQIDWCYEKIKTHYIYHGITYFLPMLSSNDVICIAPLNGGIYSVIMQTKRLCKKSIIYRREKRAKIATVWKNILMISNVTFKVKLLLP